jgi:hypothetical protein
MMLWLLIPIAWLAVLTLFVCLCRVAADADVDPSSAAVPYGPIGQRIALSRLPARSGTPARVMRSHGRSTARILAGRTGSGRRRGAAHGVR